MSPNRGEENNGSETTLGTGGADGGSIFGVEPIDQRIFVRRPETSKCLETRSLLFTEVTKTLGPRLKSREAHSAGVACAQRADRMAPPMCLSTVSRKTMIRSTRKTTLITVELTTRTILEHIGASSGGRSCRTHVFSGDLFEKGPPRGRI